MREAEVKARPPSSSPDATPAEQPPRGGRPKLFSTPTVRLNLNIPEASAKRIRHISIELGVSPSQLIDEWARRAELDHAVARGMKAIEEGHTVDQQEAERILARWG